MPENRLFPMLLPVFQRRKAGMALKNLRKVGKIGIAGFQGNQTDRDIRFGQHALGLLHLFPYNEFVQRNPRFLFEQPGQVLRVQENCLGNLRPGDIPVQVFPDIVNSAGDRAAAAGISRRPARRFRRLRLPHRNSRRR